MQLKNIITVGLTAGLVALAGYAKAVPVTYSLTTGNSAISGFTGPYGSVTVDLASNGKDATITFTGNIVGGHQFLFGGHGAVAVNVNASTWTLGTITGVNTGTGFTPGALSSGGAGNEDGFGKFNQTIDSFDGYTHSSSQVSFMLTDTGGTWASASDVLTAAPDGSLIAAHIFVATDPANASNDALNTGYAADGPVPVPDGGSTVALMGLAFLGIGSIRRVLGK